MARHHLDRLSLLGNTQELLSRGVRVGLERREPYDPILEASIGYASAVAVAVMDEVVSRIRELTSKITQVCQDIRDIKLRRPLITRSDDKPNDIIDGILTNQSDCKNTLGSSRS